MITNINEFKLYLINESNNENEIKEFNEKFTETLNNLFIKEDPSRSDWGGIIAWRISGDTTNGYFISDGKTYNGGNIYDNIDYELFHRYYDEDGETHTNFIDELNSIEDADRFLDVAKSYLNTENVNERSDFDAVATIGKITKQITIELDLKHSMHSMERQGRSSEYIKNTDIKLTVDKATPKIIDLLINNTLNAGDAVWIYDTSNDLNVVGSLLANKKTDIITFKVITCMFTKTFYNKNNTYKVTV